MYEIMFYAGTVLACLFLIISIILFIKNDVWKLMGDVTGLNARRAIKKLDKKGAEDTSKTEAIHQEVSKVLVRRATTTGSLQAVTESIEKDKAQRSDRKKTRKRRTKEEKTILLQNTQEQANSNNIFEIEDEMIILAGDQKDSVAKENEAEGEYTTLLTPEGDDSQTTLLTPEGDDSQTTLLTPEGDDSQTTLLTPEAEITPFEPVLQEDEELMSLLKDAVAKNQGRD